MSQTPYMQPSGPSKNKGPTGSLYNYLIRSFDHGSSGRNLRHRSHGSFTKIRGPFCGCLNMRDPIILGPE